MSENYTEEMTADLVQVYKACESDEERRNAVAILADKYNKSKASIRAKLAKEKVYIPLSRKSKLTGDKPRTKEQIVSEIEAIAEVLPGSFETLEKSNKLVLLKLLKIISKSKIQGL